MKITIDEIKEIQEDSILFQVKEVNDKIRKAVTYLENLETYLVGKSEDKVYKINFETIYYIETVDKKSFVYTETDVMIVNEKLYQLEEKLRFADFVRVSKSLILNINKIEFVYPSISGRFQAKLFNQEVVTIARSYVSNLKKKLGLERG